MESLPSGWVECLMGDVATVIGGGTPDAADPQNFSSSKGVPWLTPVDLSDHSGVFVSRGRRFLTKKGLKQSSARLMPKGTVLFSSRAPIGYVAVAANKVATNQGFKSFVCGKGIHSEYIFYWLRHAKPLAEELASGTTFAEISGKNAAKIPLRLAPSREQKRIVAKLEKVLAKLDACRVRLEKVPVLLKRFRQSVLAAACSGRLTADWRGEQDAHADAEKDAGELPEGWRCLPLSELCERFQYGSASKSAKTGRVPVLRMGNLQGGRIDWDDLVFTSDEDEIRKYGLTAPTVLFNRTNSPDLVGKTSIYRGERPAVFAGYLIRIIHGPKLNPEFLNYCLNTPQFKEWCLEVKSDGVSQSNINAKKLASYEIQLCSTAEQAEIVRRVEALFALADGIAARYAKAKAQVDRLTPSLLAKAFRGELVPQDPSDEPAEKLLERIRTQREAA